MSNNDVIKIEIDRSILEEYIAQLDSAIAGGRGGAGRGEIGQPKNASAKDDLFVQKFVIASNQYYKMHPEGIKEAILGIQLPDVTREQRMLLNQFGFPTRAFYNVKRVQRGVAAGLTSPTGLFMVAATVLMIVDQIKQIRADLQRQNQEYKNIFLEYSPKLTNKEYQAIKDQSTDNWGKFTNYLFGVK